MKEIIDYLQTIENPQNQSIMQGVLEWVQQNYPQLEPKIAWNQPMFTDHGTFIIGFSVAKNNFAMSPERAGIIHFSDDIISSGYEHTKMLVRFPWKQKVDFDLLKRIIDFNIEDKKNCTTFWRK